MPNYANDDDKSLTFRPHFDDKVIKISKSLSLNTISLSKVKKMYQKVILHVNRQKNPRTKILYLSPHAKQNQKSIHTFYQIFFFQLVHLQFILSKNSKKAYLQQIKQISKKKRSKKSFKKFFVQHCTCTQ